MTIRIGVVWWVGCISLILVTTLPSRTALRGPWPSTLTPTTADVTYTKLTPHLFLHNLSQAASHVLHPLTHTHTYTPLLKTVWRLKCLLWKSIVPDLTQLTLKWLCIWISQKAPTVEQSKPSPKNCVICYEKAPVAELTKPRDVEWYILNHGQQFHGQFN